MNPRLCLQLSPTLIRAAEESERRKKEVLGKLLRTLLRREPDSVESDMSELIDAERQVTGRPRAVGETYEDK
jgi:hypothetical protein